MVALRLNPAIDIKAAAAAYARDKVVQIHDVFEPEVAEAVEQAILAAPWRLLCQNDQGELLFYTEEQYRQMSPQERMQLERGIMERAARNIGYTYHAYPMVQALLNGLDPGHPIHALTHFLNGTEFLALGRAIIGEDGLTKVDAHATKYMRGHYLTRHVDEGGHRRAAYTLGFSQDWQPDWGGLLLFLSDKQDVGSGFLPRWNTLTIFDGLKLHTVTAISQFALRPRISVAGWYRDDPVG
ncbi:MAG: proline hydroxylase [Alphaproteobacteria bacterium]|nr:MAG: proline hydroxylase [Alphaproteobacteria bacterium]